MVSSGEVERLKGLVRRHRVVWEVWPATFVFKGGGTRQVGYELLLSGAHEHDWERPSPGCEKGRNRSMEYIQNRIFDEIKVGDSASLVRTLTRDDIHLFAVRGCCGIPIGRDIVFLIGACLSQNPIP